MLKEKKCLELASKYVKSNPPEDEDEEHEQREEDRDVVHRPEHHNELPTEVWKKPDEFEDPEKAEGPKHGDAGAVVAQAVKDAIVDLKGTGKYSQISH